MSSRRFVGAAALVLGALAASSSAQGAIRDSYAGVEKPVAVTISQSRLGVLAAEGATGQVRKRARALGLRHVTTYNGRIVILSLPRALTRSGLLARAGRLRGQLGAQAAQVGLLVTPRGARKPLVVTQEVVVRFDTGVSPERVAGAIGAARGEVRMQNPYEPREYLIAVPGDALATANRLHRARGVEFAHPNFVVVHEFHGVNDPLFGRQWHHLNAGAFGATMDADVDTPLAWDITQGNEDTVVAVLDDGFEAAHPDLAPNLWVHGEIPNNGVDDPPANGLVDDVNGWNFGSGSGAYAPQAHGTAVAGLVGATSDNGLGVAGVCGHCRLMLVQLAFTAHGDALAIDYAGDNGADVISNSWGYPDATPCTPTVCAAIDHVTDTGRGGLGAVMVYAMSNANVDDCAADPPELAANPRVIAVSTITSSDSRASNAAFGDCMELLAPSSRRERRKLGLTTTDRTGTAGYNAGSSSTSCIGGEASDPDYTHCFSQNSGAAAIVAGTAGLLLATNPQLTRRQVQQLLQDTADRADDKAAAYRARDGFSAPGGTGPSTHGFGRVNAFEAVRVAAPENLGGRAGKDLFMRDNVLDWGNTEQPSKVLLRPTRGTIWWFESPDIKVDSPQNGLEPSPPTTSAQFDAFVHENARGGAANLVHVRVRNRGHTPAEGFVKLYWMGLGTVMPELPSDFWTTFPQDSTELPIKVHPIGIQPLPTVPTSGSTGARDGPDQAQIVTFTFTPPEPQIGEPEPYHFCLWAVAYGPDTVWGPDDPVELSSAQPSFAPDYVTPSDNNVTQLNIHVFDRPLGTGGGGGRMFVRNPLKVPAQSRLDVEAPLGWKVSIDKFGFRRRFRLAAGAEVRARVRITPPRGRRNGDVTIRQRVVDPASGATRIGGVTYRFRRK